MISTPDPRPESIVQAPAPAGEAPAQPEPALVDDQLKKTIVGTAVGRLIGSAIGRAAEKLWDTITS